MKTFLEKLWNVLGDTSKKSDMKSAGRSFLVHAIFMTYEYLKEALRLTPELLIVTLAAYSRYWIGNPPILPIIPDGSWVVGLTSLGYISFIVYSYGFCMQVIEDSGQTLAANKKMFPIVLLFVGDVFALWAGTPEIIVIPLSLVFLSVLLVNGYSEQGKYGILPLARYPLILMGLWLVGLGEFSEAYRIKAALLEVSGQGWISLLVFSGATFLILFGSGIISQLRLKGMVERKLLTGKDAKE